jgi:hypothetical protein
MKEGKNAVHLWWENYGFGQSSDSASLWPDNQASQRMPFLWKNLFHV